MKRESYIRHLAVLGLCAVLSVRVAGALTVSETSKFEVGDTGGNSGNYWSFDMDLGGGKYAVAWLDPSSQVKVTMVPTGATSPSGTYILNSGLSGFSYQGQASIAWNGSANNFGVVWMVGNTVDSFKLYYNTVTPGGAVGSWKQLSLGSTNYHSPDIVWDGSRFVVAYSTFVGTYDLRVAAFNAAGDPVGPSALVARMPVPALPQLDPMFGGPDAMGPNIAYNGTGYAVVYTYLPENAIWYAYLNSGLSVQSGFPKRVSDTTPIHSAPRVRVGPGGEFATVWQHSGGGAGHIYFARLNSSGVVAGPTALATALDAQKPDIAWDGGRYILAWNDAPASGQWITKAATVTSGGGIEGSVVTIWPTSGASGTCVGSHAADNYLIVLRDAGFSKIYGMNASNQLLLTTSVNPVGGGTVDVPSPGSTGGTSGPYSQGQNVTVTATPTGGGDWAFTNWTGDTSGASISGNQITVTMDRAKGVTANFYNTAWPTLTLNVSPSGGGTTTINGASATSAQAAPGATMALVATANTGYIFNSWRDGGDTTTLSTNRSYTISMPGSNTTLLAKFDVAYSVSTTGNPTNGGSVSPTGALWYAAGSQVAFTASPSANYTFTGWNVNGVDSGNANPITITIDSNKTIYANFSYGGGGTTYTLLTAVSPSGTGAVAPAGTSTYASGSTVQLNATPANGYRFDHWTGSASGSTNPLNITMNANKTVTAQFEEGTSGNEPQVSGLSQKTSISSKRASFTLDYADTDGDLSGGTLKAEYRYKSGGKLYKGTYDIPDDLTSITGTTTGTIEVRILFRKWKTSYKNFDLNLYLIDTAGLSSNVISFKVRKNKKGSSTPGAIGNIDQAYDE